MGKLNFSITVSDIAETLEAAYAARRTVVFRGAPGIGKTQCVLAAAERLAAKYKEPVPVYTLHLASMSEVDLQVLMPVGSRVEVLPPVFWDTVQGSPRGILFLDELGQASPEMQKAVAPLLLEGRIGPRKLRDGWYVVGATNGTEHNSGVNTLLSHVLNRILLVDVEPPSADEWVGWAAANGLDAVLMAFARMRPDVVFSGEVPSLDDAPYCTPRSIHAASDIAKQFGDAAAMTRSPVGMALLSGAVGAGAATEIAAVVSTSLTLPSIDDVIGEPMTTRIPKDISQQYVMLLMVAMTVPFDDAALDAACKYIVRYPVNLALVGVLALCRRSSEFMMTATFSQWARDNVETLKKFRGFTDV